jgi:hypothetical protein
VADKVVTQHTQQLLGLPLPFDISLGVAVLPILQACLDRGPQYMQVSHRVEVSFEQFLEIFNCCNFLLQGSAPPFHLSLSPIFQQHSRLLNVLEKPQLQLQQIILSRLLAFPSLLVFPYYFALDLFDFIDYLLLKVAELLFEFHGPFAVLPIGFFVLFCDFRQALETCSC